MLQGALLALTYYTLGSSQCPKLVWTYFQLAPLKDSSGADPHSSEKSCTDFPKSLLKLSTDLPEICNSQKSKISELVFKNHNNLLSVCPSPLGSLGLRYHMKTQGAVSPILPQLGLEPNPIDLTPQLLFFLEESCRIKMQ